MIQIGCIETNEEFSGLEREWNSLLRQSPVDDAFLTWEWIHTWWKHYGNSYQLCLLVAREEGRLLGIAPLMLETQKVLWGKTRMLRNIGIPPSDVGGIIIQNGREDVLVRFALWLIDNQEMWDVLLIGGIPPNGMNFDAWIDQFSRDVFTTQVDTTRFFYIPMDGDWNKYYQGLSKNLRRDLNRKIRHLQEGNGYHDCHKLGRDATTKDIETIFRINQNARHSYLYREQAEQEFHKELAELMANQGWLDIYFLFIGDTPVAFYYGFYYNQTFEYWRTGFDGVYYPLSVGKVLLYLIIKDGFEHGMKFFNFLLGDEDYKLDWQVEPRIYSQIRVVRKAPIPLLAHIYFPELKISVSGFLKQHRMLHPLLKWIERFVNFKQNRQSLTQTAKSQIKSARHEIVDR